MDEQINNEATLAEPPKDKIEQIAQKLNMSKKKLIILGSIAIFVIVAVIITLLCIPSRFERVKNEALNIAGQISHRGDDNFTIDTYPYEDTNLNSAVISALAPDSQRKALEAIQYVNEELGFNGAVYNRMMETNALMGRQSEENDKYRVSWTYHPDEGLEVTYEKK